MKEKFDFVYNVVTNAMKDLNAKKINVDQAKALASLAKQANNIFATQVDAAKFMANSKDAKEKLTEVGLISNEG